MTRLKSTPLVVLDWGWLRARPAAKEILPARYQYLLSDVVLAEVCGLCSGDEATGYSYAEKLIRILRGNRGRIVVARQPEQLFEIERDPNTLISLQQLIHPELTTELAEAELPSFEELVEIIKDVVATDQSLHEYERRRGTFLDDCNAWAEDSRSQFEPKLFSRLASNTELRRQVLREPNLIWGWIEARMTHDPDGYGRFNSQEWRSALEHWPDRCAIGRWLRIMYAYGLWRQITPEGDDHKFENNWDDARYAFLASYTGWLATNDGGLKQLVADIFPEVKLWPTTAE
ncbi:MAG: hypothetical protein IH984_09490 [Planctomycetes bacterium]|nr:hypothetical protein [Planctomycetota bacterium]